MRFLVLKALSGLLLYDLFLVRNFRRLHRIVTSWTTTSKRKSPDTVERVTHAVDVACSWYPKRVFCLQRAAVSVCLLRSCGVHAQLTLGARKLPFNAHAWVEVDGCAVNESRDVKRIFGVWENC
jgi:transglutaminase superfamily protein